MMLFWVISSPLVKVTINAALTNGEDQRIKDNFDNSLIGLKSNFSKTYYYTSLK